ncbi:MAG: hypothetical protein AB1466_01590 [Actinomycetota bacterium]
MRRLTAGDGKLQCFVCGVDNPKNRRYCFVCGNQLSPEVTILHEDTEVSQKSEMVKRHGESGEKPPEVKEKPNTQVVRPKGYMLRWFFFYFLLGLLVVLFLVLLWLLFQF